ncbi:EthD family reductase [Sphingosinicella terrae]|uniref:EthD family reductase n=1 Tax=Sphingosinicella terrae TaxID=2172047 RepID=UPI000E0D0765|nr:EthD family reductase [Sphingosinicella terrae]
MPTITVLYPRQDGATFDFDYYARTHLPLVEARWKGNGLTGVEALRGVAVDGGEPPFLAIALISFDTMESLGAAVNGPHMAEIGADIANFTNVRPVRQVSEAIR